MATEAVVFFDSRLTEDELARVPERLLAECAAFRGFCKRWGWPAEPAPYEWRVALEDGDHHCTAAERWPRRQPVTLFGPGGHLSFGPGWLQWDSETKWSWLFDGRVERARLIEAARQLATLVGAQVGLVTGDWGADDAVLDVLEAGGGVRDAIAAVSAGRELLPLEAVPLVDPGTYPRPDFGAYFLLNFA